MCGLCFRGPEDIDHVLCHCGKATELWRNVLGHEVTASLNSLSFEDWLHGNISGRLPAIIGRPGWDMEFAIYCWLLWKLRCTDKLAKLGQQASLQGNRFAAPPASVALAVAADKQHWEDVSVELEVA
ncbi:hypothetical protein V6N13_093066 [Hibiscus sabdariffa]